MDMVGKPVPDALSKRGTHPQVLNLDQWAVVYSLRPHGQVIFRERKFDFGGNPFGTTVTVVGLHLDASRKGWIRLLSVVALGATLCFSEGPLYQTA